MFLQKCSSVSAISMASGNTCEENSANWPQTVCIIFRNISSIQAHEINAKDYNRNNEKPTNIVMMGRWENRPHMAVHFLD